MFILDFELTRTENDEALLSQINTIKTAENLQVLIPFAKAYLGMFYVIDKELAEKDKVKLLANDELAEAIFSGFIASLNREELPSIEQIGHARAEQKEFSEGYVVLAGLDIIAKQSLSKLKKLESSVIEKGVGFYFSNKSGYHDIWFDYLLEEDKYKVIPCITKYWVAMLKNNATYLPGRNLVFSEKPNVEIIQDCVLLLLENWTVCKPKVLLQLLYLSFKHVKESGFLLVCEHALENDMDLSERARLYWIASAYLLSPDKYYAKLSSYVGRVKLKIMPLLDFIVLIMNDKTEVNIDNKVIVQLLRMIAPIFPPQHHVYGAIGELDINSRNVMLMFYHLACSNETDAVDEIKSLRKARVMKIYSPVIDNLLALHLRKKNEEDFVLPSFDFYIKDLAENNCLQGRSNKFDLR